MLQTKMEMKTMAIRKMALSPPRRSKKYQVHQMKAKLLLTSSLQEHPLLTTFRSIKLHPKMQLKLMHQKASLHQQNSTKVEARKTSGSSKTKRLQGLRLNNNNRSQLNSRHHSLLQLLRRPNKTPPQSKMRLLSSNKLFLRSNQGTHHVSGS